MTALLEARRELSEYIKVKLLLESAYSTETRIQDVGHVQCTVLQLVFMTSDISDVSYGLSNRTRVSRTLIVSNPP